MTRRFHKIEHLKLEGIFRLSGSLTLINELKASIDKGKLDVFKFLCFSKGNPLILNTQIDPHAVAGLLKLYIRELPEVDFFIFLRLTLK
jgi:hypothetical protein